MALVTHFLTLDVALTDPSTDLVAAIEAQLRRQGEPLRWAITQINPSTQTATVEAVVTTVTDP